MPRAWSYGWLAVALGLATSLAWAGAESESKPHPVPSPAPDAAMARAACASRDACLADLQSAQADTRSIHARFRQVKHTALLDEPLVSTGRFYFAKPDRVRLDLETPTPLQLEVVGGKLSGAGNSAPPGGSPAAIAGMLARMGALFSGAVTELEGSFEVQARALAGSPGSPPGIEVVLFPRDEAWRRLYRRIALQFTAPELLATRVTLEDGLGDSLELELLEPRRNDPDPTGAK